MRLVEPEVLEHVEEERLTAPDHDFVDNDGWWATASPQELRDSAAVVRGFLEGTVVANSESIEAFARALALRQLLRDKDAVLKAACGAYDLMPSVSTVGVSSEMVSRLETWLPRGNAIDTALNRCLELLKPLYEPTWQAVVCRFHMGLLILGKGYIDAAMHGGLRFDFRVTKSRRRFLI